MEQNANQALIMGFSIIIFVLALSYGMFMLSQVSETSIKLALYADTTTFYDHIKIDEDQTKGAFKKGVTRLVTADTVIPTLYRYTKERFCVKIYDENNKLIQVFDSELEGKVRDACSKSETLLKSKAEDSNANQSDKESYAYLKIYSDDSKAYYLFEAPWLGSTENIKRRVDLYINGQAGYINDKYVDYSKKNAFCEALQKNYQFEEQFISYSYTGDTFETKEGDTLVLSTASKDKVVITYTIVK